MEIELNLVNGMSSCSPGDRFVPSPGPAGFQLLQSILGCPLDVDMIQQWIAEEVKDRDEGTMRLRYEATRNRAEVYSISPAPQSSRLSPGARKLHTMHVRSE